MSLVKIDKPADHFISFIAEYDVSDADLKALATTDGFLKRAVEEYIGEPVDEDDDGYSDD